MTFQSITDRTEQTEAEPAPRSGPSTWRPWSDDLSERTAPAVAGSVRVWRTLAVLAVLCAALAHAAMAAAAHAPVFPFDEITLLLFSAHFAGIDGVGAMHGAGYFPGWAVLMAPIWWFTSDPATMYRAAIWWGAFIGLATIWPLSRIAVRLGLTVPQSICAGALVMTLPSRTVQAGNTMSEKPLFFAIAVLVWLALRTWERPTILRALSVGVMALAALAFHARAQVVVIAVLVWLLCLVVRNWKATLVALPVTAVSAKLLNEWAISFNNAMLTLPYRQGEGVFQTAAEQPPGLIARSFLAQMWTQSVGSGGLFLLGGAALICLVWAEVRRFRIGPMCLVAAMIAGFVIISVASWANEQSMYFAEWRRLDAWIYGRYMDPVTALVVLIGVCALVRVMNRAARVIVLLGGAALLGIVVLRIAPAAPTWAFVTPAHLPGVMPWRFLLPGEPWEHLIQPTFFNVQRFWVWASLPTLLVLTAIAVVRWRSSLSRAAGIAVLLALATVGSVLSVRANEYFQSVEGAIPAIAEPAREIASDHDARIYFDMECRVRGVNFSIVDMQLYFWTEPHPVVLAPTREQIREDGVLVYTCTENPFGADSGARRVGDEQYAGYSLWVTPGPLLDELESEGLLQQEPQFAG